MEMLKSKATVALILMILGVAFVGGMDNEHFEENNSTYEISANA